jgi:DNA-binding transcriptional LysR family regulator
MRLNPKELEQLVAFADAGTLAKVSETHYLSQPSLTRNMKHLEEVFGVPLFERAKNRLTLTETGKKAVEESRKILSTMDEAVQNVRDFYQSTLTVSIASCAPFPLWTLLPKIAKRFPNKRISSVIRGNDDVLKALDEENLDIYILSAPIEKEGYSLRTYMREKLFIAVPDDHALARKKSVTFAEINGYNFILRSGLGFWDDLIRVKMPASKFLVQTDDEAFEELKINSTLPYFVTDLSQGMESVVPGRKRIEISDPESSVTYYLLVRKDL